MPLIATVDSYCKGCKHLCGPEENKSCKYLQNVGRRRPCPAGDGCTAHTGRKHGKTSIPAMDEQIAMKLLR